MNQNMDKFIKQAKKMQEQMKKIKSSQKNIEIEGQSGAGLVKVTMTGKYDAKKVIIDQSLMSENKEIIEDLIVAAINNTVHKIEEETKFNINNFSKEIELSTDF